MATTFFIKTNFGRGTLNSGITDVATSMTLDAGHTLPPSGGDFRVALYDSDTYPYPGDDINMEIVTANWSSGNTYTITRAQEGTSGVAHSAADRVANMITGGSLEELETAINARTERASAEIVTGAWTFDGLFKWGDTTKDHDYIIGVSELDADRTITLPLLTGNDVFTFNDFAATLTNKTINTASNTITVNLADVSDVTASVAEVNLLNLSGLSVGEVLRATGASSAAWQSILEADISDGSLLARLADAEVITGVWRFDASSWIQKTATVAFLIGKDSDGGDLFVADTTNMRVAINSAPSAAFHVNLQGTSQGTVPTGITESISAIVQANFNASDGCAFYIIGGSGTGSSNLYLCDADDRNVGGIQYLHTDNSMLLRTNDATRVTISSAGDVGIGLAPVVGCRLLLPSQNDAVTPTLAFGDGNTGFYEQSDNVLILSLAGAGSITFDVAWFFSTSNAAGWAIVDETPSTTNPVFTFRGDTDTGMGRASTDQLALIAGAEAGIVLAQGAWGCSLHIPEITTPSALTNWGAIYTKADNKLYFQDGAGTEYTVTIV